ncbi:MAG TPA: exodeoxyribonuclease VII large subunit, partial [Clostridiales bacterium]|nr:exodeoxyribonuclease VII large subunit [Clostridiales bacterium]
KLAAEGLFDAGRKKPLPRFPARIAVITSSAGAAVHDIIRVMGKRWPSSKIILLPVRVQGPEAPPEIASALRYANRHRVAELIITGRGGGSIEDLWAFNDERVARAIAESVIPVISAVGHEPDVTIADFVADLRAATPSNAAELAVPDENEIREGLLSADIRLSQAMRKQIGNYRRSLDDTASRRVMRSPTGFIDQRRLELDGVRMRMTSASGAVISEKRNGHISLAAKLDALSPLKVLGRGYAIASAGDGSVVRDAGQVEVGDLLRLRLAKGGLACRVEHVVNADGRKV